MNVKLLLGEDKQTCARRIAVAAILLSFAAFVLTAMFDRGSLLGQLFFRDTADTFMDYFNCLPGVAMRRPYDTESMYPPLSEVIFYLFSKIIEPDMLVGLDPRLMRVQQIPLLSFLLYLAVPIAVMVWALADYLRGDNVLKRFVIIAFLVTSPFLYTIERGNVLIYSLAAAIVFICYYDSEKKWQREVALIALAVSAGIKLYPAILGFVLIRDKRWKETIRCVIYGVICFFGPFAIFGGFESLKIMISALTANTGGFGNTEFAGKINFANIINVINIEWFGGAGEVGWAQIAAYIISILLVGASFLTKRRWKSILFLTLVMIGAPAFSFYYTGVFMLVPFLMFIAGGEKELKDTDIIYLLAFIAILAPIPITDGDIYHTSVINDNQQVVGVAMLVMALWGFIDAVIDLMDRICPKKEEKAEPKA